MTPLSNPFIQQGGRKPTCMEMLQIIIDGEASKEQQEYFKVHMDKCLPCFKTYNVDMAIKEMLKTKCCGGQAPNDLVEQIKSQLNLNIR